jgi:hypothetical protein
VEPEPSIWFKESANKENTLRPLLSIMTRLRCLRCGVDAGCVTDTRFGLVPTATLCPACSVPAFLARRS